MFVIRFTVVAIALGGWYATAIPFPQQGTNLPSESYLWPDQATATLVAPPARRGIADADSINQHLQQLLVSLQNEQSNLQNEDMSQEERIKEQQEIQRLQLEIQELQGKLLQVKQAQQLSS
ncbi:hypothetical protein IWQ61_009779 [Dispira simplex]|nr:hypothetical protein IWQ61_009779 [Dispira simplex]